NTIGHRGTTCRLLGLCLSGRALPAFHVALACSGHTQRVVRDILSNGRACGGGRHCTYRYRRHQRRVRADEGTVADTGHELVHPIVVAGDGTRADIRAAAHLRVTDVGQVIDLRAGTQHGLLGLDKVADLGSGVQPGTGTQPGIRTDVTLLADLGAVQVAERLDHRAGLDHRITNHAVRLDDHPVLDHHPTFEHHVDVNADIPSDAYLTPYVESCRISQRGALDHQPLGFTG